MKRLLSLTASEVLLVLVGFGLSGCASGDRAHSLDESKRTAALVCQASNASGPIMSMFSLSLARPVSEAKQAELCFYFDGDDCAGGAIIGHHDEKGWLFPIGKYQWQQLRQYEVPSGDEDSTEGITPVTKAQEGFAFRVKTLGGRNAIVRISKVHPATYDAVSRGETASIEFEWVWR